MNFTISDAHKLLNIIQARRDVRGNRFVERPTCIIILIKKENITNFEKEYID